MRRNLNFYFATLSELDVLSALMSSRGGRDRLAAWFAGRVGGRAYAFSSGRASLRAILRAVRIGAGDEVILCGFTCLAVPEAVRYAGATPVYADLAPGAWASGADEIASVASARTRAVVVQHTFGIPAAVDQVLGLCRSRGWLLVEDCALALGSERAGRPLGSFGAASIFSFELSKCVTAGWGGAAVIHDAELDQAMARLYAEEPEARRLRILRELAQILLSTMLYRPRCYGTAKYLLAALYRSGLFRVSGRPLAAGEPSGWSHRLSASQAALVARQLARLDSIRQRAAEIVGRYRTWLDDTGRPDSSGPRDKGVHLIRFPILAENASALVTRGYTRGIEIGRWFDAPVAPMPGDPSLVNYTWGSCPRAERVSRHVVNLPVHPRLNDGDVSAILRMLDEVDMVALPQSAF